MQILTIRFYQFKRNLGFLFFVFLFALSGLSYFFFQSYKEVGLYVAIIIIYIVFSFHKTRGDLAFVSKHFQSSQKQIITEYQLFLLPVTIPCLFTQYYYCFFIIHAVALLIPLMEVTTKYKLKLSFLASWFKDDFIFISGFRKNFIALIVLFSVSLLLSPLKLFPLIALFLFNMIIFSFYESNESVQLLQSKNFTPKQLLYEQSRMAVMKLFGFNFLVLSINCLFNPEVLMFDLYFLGYSILMLFTLISAKYANYDHRRSQSNVQAKLIIMTLGLFMPYLSPLAIVFLFQSRSEAINNLSRYLDDKH